MKVENERKSTDVVFDIDLTEDEFNLFLEYGKTRIPEDELNKLLVEWAILNTIEEKVGKTKK